MLSSDGTSGGKTVVVVSEFSNSGSTGGNIGGSLGITVVVSELSNSGSPAVIPVLVPKAVSSPVSVSLGAHEKQIKNAKHDIALIIFIIA